MLASGRLLTVLCSEKQIAIQAFANQIKQQYNLQQFNLWLTQRGDLKLNDIIVRKENRKQGIGSQVIKALCTFADKYKLRIIVSPGVKDTAYGVTSRSRLVRFYKRFGFIENKGKDFTISESMFRLPRG